MITTIVPYQFFIIKNTLIQCQVYYFCFRTIVDFDWSICLKTASNLCSPNTFCL